MPSRADLGVIGNSAKLVPKLAHLRLLADGRDIACTAAQSMLRRDDSNP